jgi:hypothetical protein
MQIARESALLGPSIRANELPFLRRTDNCFQRRAAKPTSPFRAHDLDHTSIKHNAIPYRSFAPHPFCVKLTPMGSKDKGRKEVKKAPKPKPKPEPGRKREGFAPAPPK